MRDALACDTVLDFMTLVADGRNADPSSKSDRPAEPVDCKSFRVREWPYMFSLSVCWALESRSAVNKAALVRALQRLKKKHGALGVHLADPPALWDFAMEAASNLSFSRAMLLSGSVSHQSRQPTRLARILDSVGSVLWAAWPRLEHAEGDSVDVPLEVVRCESSQQLEMRSAWLLDGRNARQFLTGPMHAVLLELPGTSGEPEMARLHIAVSHGLSDGFSGMPLLQDFVRFYEVELTGSEGGKHEVRLQTCGQSSEC